MKARVLAGAAIVATAFVMTGCMTAPGVVMDKSIPLEQGGYTVLNDEKPVSCKMHLWTIFGYGLPPIFEDVGVNSIKDAVSMNPGHLLYEKCKAKANADALIEYNTDVTGVYLYFVSWACYNLTGTPVKVNKK